MKYNVSHLTSIHNIIKPRLHQGTMRLDPQPFPGFGLRAQTGEKRPAQSEPGHTVETLVTHPSRVIRRKKCQASLTSCLLECACHSAGAQQGHKTIGTGPSFNTSDHSPVSLSLSRQQSPVLDYQQLTTQSERGRGVGGVERQRPLSLCVVHSLPL